VYADGVTTGSEPLPSIAAATHGARPSFGVRTFEDSSNGAPNQKGTPSADRDHLGSRIPGCREEGSP
jgi:hypothetical protein